jgi:hypothetical protein
MKFHGAFKVVGIQVPSPHDPLRGFPGERDRERGKIMNLDVRERPEDSEMGHDLTMKKCPKTFIQ